MKERKQFNMKTPYMTEQFFTVFEKYNTEVFPFHLLIFLLGTVASLLVPSTRTLKNKLIGSFLGLLWI